MEEVGRSQNRIGRNFTFWQMIRFVLPTMATQLFMAIFATVDDGLFVTNYVGPDALSAIQVIFPLNMLTNGLAMVFASGGSAVCARKMGEGKQEEARRSFNSIFLMTLIGGAFISLMCLSFQKPVLRLLGATELLMTDCIAYSTLMWIFRPLSMACPLFDFFYATAGKPTVSMIASITNGIINIVGDIVFIVWLDMGIAGAAWATIVGDMAYWAVGLIFYSNKKHELHFTKPWPHFGKLLKEIFSIGIAQFLNNISLSVSSFIANSVVLGLAGETGLAAYSIVGYMRYMMNSTMGGFSNGVASIFSFNYGARNKERIKRYFWYAVKFLAVISVIITVLCIVCAPVMIKLYVQPAEEPEVYAMVLHAMHVVPFAFAFIGFAMFSARFFAAMNNGKVASAISFMRNAVFVTASMIIMPLLFGLEGVWLASPMGELLGFILIVTLLYINRNNYGYGKKGIALRIPAPEL